MFDQAEVGRFLSRIAVDLPDSLRLIGIVTVIPNYDTSARGSIGRRSSFIGVADLTVPLTLSLHPGLIADTAEMGDTTGDGSSDSWLDRGTLDNVNFGRITIDVENSLPASFASQAYTP